MPDTVKTPLGTFPKKGVIIGVVAVGGLAAVVYYRHKTSASSASTATTAASGTTAAGDAYSSGFASDPYPPDGTSGDPADPDSTDPSTGQTYGDEQSGYGSAADYGAYGSPLQDAGTSGATSQYTTNAQWAQAAEQYLVSEEGADANTVGNALGKYITGQPVTADQQDIIEQAIAFTNYPPVNGGTGYPPSIQLVKGSTGTTGTSTKVKVPNVVGDTVDTAHSKLKAAGLSYNADTSKGQKGYERKITKQNPKAGAEAAKGSKVSLTWHYVKS